LPANSFVMSVFAVRDPVRRWRGIAGLFSLFCHVSCLRKGGRWIGYPFASSILGGEQLDPSVIPPSPSNLLRYCTSPSMAVQAIALAQSRIIHRLLFEAVNHYLVLIKFSKPATAAASQWPLNPAPGRTGLPMSSQKASAKVEITSK
jgi:hypothetical protein